MLCPSCRRQLSRDASVCAVCGAPRPGADAPLELVLPDGTRVPVTGEIVIGRAPGSTLVIEEPSVSRMHARITAGRNGAPLIEDAGSSHGTWVDGTQVQDAVALRDGSRIQLGNAVLSVERHRDQAEAGRTIVVAPGASLLVSAVGQAQGVATGTTAFGMRPRMRSGYALKRLEAEEGNKRFVLRDLRSDKFLRFSERDAEILERLDGSHSLVDLIGFAEQRHGAAGSARVARLLADLSERGFLSGVASAEAAAEGPQGFFRRMIGPREKSVRGLGGFFDRLYSAGGWLLFTRPALAFIGALIVAGIAGFVYLVAGRYGTPFVVADKIGLGGLVFLVGRFLVVAVHETAHGLTMSSFGRKVDRAGLKFIFVIPFAFVDTSEAWFEPRRRRIAISAAGPVSDFSLGAVFALCSVFFGGTVREIFFQLAFAAYVGAFFNLNPWLDRDGYHMMVDWLREPGLRRRAKEQLERRLSRRGATSDNRVLLRYSVAGVIWSIVLAGFVIVITLRYEPILSALAPKSVVWGVLGTLWLALFIPVFISLGKPLWMRMRGRGPEPA